MPYTNTVGSTEIKFTWTGAAASFNSIQLIPNIELSAQLEIERKFTIDRDNNASIASFLIDPFVTKEAKRSVFLIPLQYVTLNTTTNQLTAFSMSEYNFIYYRTNAPATPVTIKVPNSSTSTNNIITIRRKTITNQTLINWVDGGKLTSAQLNTQTKQFLYVAFLSGIINIFKCKALKNCTINKTLGFLNSRILIKKCIAFLN